MDTVNPFLTEVFSVVWLSIFVLATACGFLVQLGADFGRRGLPITVTAEWARVAQTYLERFWLNIKFFERFGIQMARAVTGGPELFV
ncbi:hypothetical protein AQ723_17735 [Burkholderia pseudomallei]|nr:hypothetical protein AQ723_17735 [Burkholderia pseudomallei]